MTRDSLLPPGFELCYANHDFRLALPSALAAERRRAALDRAERERSQPHVEEPPAEYGWQIIDAHRAVSSVDRAEVF